MVELPHPLDYEDSMGLNDDIIITAVAELGMEVLYTTDELIEGFYNMFGGIFTEDDDEFWSTLGDYCIVNLEDTELFYQYEGLMYRPAPPNAKVGIIEQGQKMLFDHYRSGRR